MSRTHRVTLFFIILTASPKARAFDPFTLAAGAKAASGMANLLGQSSPEDTLNDLADSGLAIGEIMNELEIDPTLERDAERLVRKLDSIRSSVATAKHTQEELREVLSLDDLKAKSFSEKLRSVRRFLQVMKRVGALIGYRPKAAEKVLLIEQVHLNHMILNELMSLKQHQFSSHLETQERSVQRKVILEKLQAEETVERERNNSNFRQGASR